MQPISGSIITFLPQWQECGHANPLKPIHTRAAASQYLTVSVGAGNSSVFCQSLSLIIKGIIEHSIRLNLGSTNFNSRINQKYLSPSNEIFKFLRQKMMAKELKYFDINGY